MPFEKLRRADRSHESPSTQSQRWHRFTRASAILSVDDRAFNSPRLSDRLHFSLRSTPIYNSARGGRRREGGGCFITEAGTFNRDVPLLLPQRQADGRQRETDPAWHNVRWPGGDRAKQAGVRRSAPRWGIFLLPPLNKQSSLRKILRPRWDEAGPRSLRWCMFCWAVAWRTWASASRVFLSVCAQLVLLKAFFETTEGFLFYANWSGLWNRWGVSSASGSVWCISRSSSRHLHCCNETRQIFGMYYGISFS